jgi:hypothetical protein
MRLALLDATVKIYQDKESLFVVDCLGDTVMEASANNIADVLSGIDRDIPSDVALWLKIASHADICMAIYDTVEITDWNRIPQDARKNKPIKPSELVGV